MKLRHDLILTRDDLKPTFVDTFISELEMHFFDFKPSRFNIPHTILFIDTDGKTKIFKTRSTNYLKDMMHGRS